MAEQQARGLPTGFGKRPAVRWLADARMPPGLAPSGAERLTIPGEGPVEAERLLAQLAPCRDGRPVVILTARPIKAKHCESVFGYADPGRQVAMVSAAGLGEGEAARRRLEAVAAHELGHLRGLRHCRTPECVMHPASTAQDLDRRSLDSCGRCARGARWRVTAAAAVLLIACSMTADAVIAKLRGRREVFAWRPEGAGAAVLMRAERILLMKSRAAAEEASRGLNELYAELSPPPVELREQPGGAVLRAGVRTIVRWDDVLEPPASGQARAGPEAGCAHPGQRGNG